MPTWEELMRQRMAAGREPRAGVSWGFRKPNLSVSWGFRLPAASNVALILVVFGMYLAIGQQGTHAPLTESQVSSPTVTVNRNPSSGLSEAHRDVRQNFTAASAIPQKAAAKFVVSFGRYRDQATAETRAREVRRKGYTASVTRDGNRFLVIGRVHQSRGDAARWSQLYREIGLHAAVLPWVKRGI